MLFYPIRAQKAIPDLHQVLFRVDQRLQTSSVEGDHGIRRHRRFPVLPFHFSTDVVSQLQDQIRLSGHFPCLTSGEIRPG